ncbi:hypothetical protein [Flavobacterium caeni]|uniref:Uncharacterized protein n=1 Tax=Flavobacterium caeni TaxID=490189 RepID=A0A1G5IVR9_9FLAO|nr:hypothetical protein [Flavobacterium caeni]SCY79709.1 hypothetical protein SAMN02927903_02405 [Flavobacterium caeni]
MSPYIYIKKNGFYVKSGKLVKIDRPLSFYMLHVPKFEKTLTFFDLMKILKKHEHDVDQTFLAYTRGFKFNAFYNESISEAHLNEDFTINRLEFSWAVDVDNFKEFGPPLFEITEYVNLTGKKKNDKENYGLAFANLSNLKTATFKLNTKIEYSRYSHGEIWEEKKLKKTKFLNGIKEFKFGEVIGSLLYEISFFGYPNDRDEKFDELDTRRENMDDEDFIPLEKVQLDWKQKSLIEWEKKKDTKQKTLKIEKLHKEIDYLRTRLIEIENSK